MAHSSDNCKRLKKRIHSICSLKDLSGFGSEPAVLLLLLPPLRSDADAAASEEAFNSIARFCERAAEESTVCILTSPPDAARLLPFLTERMRYQLWVAVKNRRGFDLPEISQLNQKHSALLVLTRYQSSLRHTITRVAYTFCPLCGKSTKDYGGKKHLYNPYGTLLSDVWRDIDCDPATDTHAVEDRLQDLFGLPGYRNLEVVDMRQCDEILPRGEPASDPGTAALVADGEAKAPLDSRLINGDCLTALAAIPEASVDFCFADPPYNIQKKYDNWNDALETQEYFAWCDRWLSELARILKPGATMAVINIPLWAVRHYQHLCKTLRFQAWIAWDGLSLPVRMIMPSHYAIVCFSKGQPRPLPGLREGFLSTRDGQNALPAAEFYCSRQPCVATRNRERTIGRENFSDLWHDIHRLKHNSRRADHPCQLPPALMARLFSLFTMPGEIVLDCFNGVGTSTLVAKQMNRKFIGIELSADYHKAAKDRHEMDSRGEDPFAKRAAVPHAKNSRVERLPKQKYEVSKKTLQLEVRRIARNIGRLPNRDDVKAMSRYPIEFFDNYFISWGEVCAAARHDGMSELPENPRGNERQPLLFQTL